VISKSIALIALMTLAISGCSAAANEGATASATPFIVTATLPPTPTPRASETPLPPPPSPTAAPVEGTTSTQVNIRAEPSTASGVLGIIPPNTKIQIVGKDSGENWWQIVYQPGIDGKGWVAAQFITTATKPEVPVIGGDGADPDNESAAIIQQKLNVRSGPGTGFNTIGTLNPQEVANLTGKDPNGVWLQIDFASGPEGKGWISAAFVRAQGVESLPIVTEAGLVVGTGTPTGIPLPPTPTVVPAPMDGDSAQSPAVNVALSATGTQSFQYSSDVSSPDGDREDWIQFTSDTRRTLLELECAGNGSLSLEVSQGNSILQHMTCGQSALVDTAPGVAYIVHVLSLSTNGLQYSQFTLRVVSIP